MKVSNIKWGVLLTYVTLLANIVLSLLFTPLMIKILGPGEHGVYSTVVSTMSWLTMLGLGIGNSYIRFYSKYKANNRYDAIAKLNGTFLIIFLIIGLITFVLGFGISQNLHLIFEDGLTAYEYSIAKPLAIIVAFDLAISFPMSVFTSIISVHERYIELKLVNLFRCIASPLISIPLLFAGYGSIGMVACSTIVDVVGYAINLFYCLIALKSKFVFAIPEKSLFVDIFSFSLFIFLNQLINKLNTTFDKVLLARLMNTVSVSVYSIGYSLTSYYQSFASAVSSVFAPRIYRAVSENEADRKRMKEVLTNQFTKLGRIHFLIQLLMLSGIIFFGKRFIFFWAGENYGNSYWVAVILCVSFTIPLCQSIGIEIQTAKNLHRYRTLIYSIMVGTNIVLTILFIPRYSEIGAALATMIVTIIGDVIVMNIFYHRKVDLDMISFWKGMKSIFFAMIIPTIVGVTIMLFIQIDSIFMLFLLIVIYTVIYCISMWKYGMNKYEKNLILSSGPIRLFQNVISSRRGKKNGH